MNFFAIIVYIFKPSIIVIIVHLFYCYLKICKFLAGITCPPVPPVINKKFFHNSSFFLFVKDNKKPNKNATEIMEDPP